MKKKLFIAVAVILSLNFISCKTANNKQENSVDWAGTYTGIIPSGSGEGIDVKITLSAEETYAIEYRYIGKSDSVFANTGKFSRSSDKKDVIIFEKESEGDFSTYYKLGENTLTHLNLDGDVITGEFADDYVLKKQQGQ